MHEFGLSGGLEEGNRKLTTWVLGEETEVWGIVNEDPGTRPGFETVSTPVTLSLTFPSRNNTLALLNATGGTRGTLHFGEGL